MRTAEADWEHAKKHNPDVKAALARTDVIELRNVWTEAWNAGYQAGENAAWRESRELSSPYNSRCEGCGTELISGRRCPACG
jgi:hypothetical protein